VGNNLDAVSINAMDQADMIFPVMQATMPYIRYGKQLLGVFKSLDYRKDKIHVIVNRYGNGGEINLQDMKTAFNTGIYKIIPNDFKLVATSINQGVPVLKLDQRNPISKALGLLAKGLVGGETPHASPSSWISKMLKLA
jgi:pilus assembly protein CpaE